MKNQELEAFSMAFGVMAEVFNEPISDVKISAYWDCLRDLDHETILQSMSQCVKHSKFFPRPADIRELVEGTRWDKANLQLMKLQREIVSVGRYGTPVLEPEMEMAVFHLGGWWAVCQMDQRKLENKFPSAWSNANALGQQKEIEEGKGAPALRDSNGATDNT